MIQTNTKKILVSLIAVFAFLGFADATYLTIEHFQNELPSCTVVEGCDVVLTSSYSEIAGAPVALGGVLFYLSVIILCFYFLESNDDKALRVLRYIAPFGFLATSYFVFLQLFIIKSICLYCMGSATTSTIIFIMSFFLKEKNVHILDTSNDKG